MRIERRKKPAEAGFVLLLCFGWSRFFCVLETVSFGIKESHLEHSERLIFHDLHAILDLPLGAQGGELTFVHIGIDVRV